MKVGHMGAVQESLTRSRNHKRARPLDVGSNLVDGDFFMQRQDWLPVVGFAAREHINECVLEKCREHKAQTRRHPYVNRLKHTHASGDYSARMASIMNTKYNYLTGL